MKNNKLLPVITTGFAFLGIGLLFLKVGIDVNNEVETKASNLKMAVSMSVQQVETVVKETEKPEYDLSEENLKKWEKNAGGE